MDLNELDQGISRSVFLSGGSSGARVSWLFLDSRGLLHSLAWGPSSIFIKSAMEMSTSHVASLWSRLLLPSSTFKDSCD